MTDTITITRDFLERQLAVGLEYLEGLQDTFESDTERLTAHLWNNGKMVSKGDLYDAEFEADLRQAMWQVAVAAAAMMSYDLIRELIKNAGRELSLLDIAENIFKIMSQGPPKEESDGV